MTSPRAIPDNDTLDAFERMFLAAVLRCQGVSGPPTDLQFQQALDVMIAYAQQVQDNPPSGKPSKVTLRWLADLPDSDRVMIAAVAFLRFGATKPSVFQLRAAYQELYGPAAGY